MSTKFVLSFSVTGQTTTYFAQEITMRQYSANLLIVFGYLAFVFSVKASLENEDYYTSLVGIQKLAVEEQGIITSVLGYRNRLKKRLELLDGYVQITMHI